MVIASAERLTAILHFWRNSKSTAEINVPACPIPTHQTKLVISQAHPIVLFNPQVPIPVPNKYKIPPTPYRPIISAKVNKIYHPFGAFPSIGLHTSFVMSVYDLWPSINGSLIAASLCIANYFSVLLN